MAKRERNNTIIRTANRVKSVHPVVEVIANNLTELDAIRFIRISQDLLQASSETSGGKQKNPVARPGHPTAIGVALILDTDRKEILFFEMTSAKKGYGSKMVDAVLKNLPPEWRVVVMMDWSGGFWERMNEKYERIEMV